jgi:hypothetical protein
VSRSPVLAPLLSRRSPAAARYLAGPVRWALVGFLLLGLLLLGLFSEQVITWLISVWQQALQKIGAGHYAASLQSSVNSGIAKRPLPAIATYAAVYLSTCLLLLHLLLAPAQWQLAWRLYVGGLAGYVLITLLVKLTGNAEWAYRLSRQLLDFIISPLPVAGLYILFRAGFGPPAAERK